MCLVVVMRVVGGDYSALWALSVRMCLQHLSRTAAGALYPEEQSCGDVTSPGSILATPLPPLCPPCLQLHTRESNTKSIHTKLGTAPSLAFQEESN